MFSQLHFPVMPSVPDKRDKVRQSQTNIFFIIELQYRLHFIMFTEFVLLLKAYFDFLCIPGPYKSVLFLIWFNCQKNGSVVFLYNSIVECNLGVHVPFLSVVSYLYFPIAQAGDLLMLFSCSGPPLPIGCMSQYPSVDASDGRWYQTWEILCFLLYIYICD